MISEKPERHGVPIPIIAERASEPPKQCEYCDTGTLHYHVVIMDTGFVEYLRRYGEFTEDAE